jgi:hypothetical protein
VKKVDLRRCSPQRASVADFRGEANSQDFEAISGANPVSTAVSRFRSPATFFRNANKSAAIETKCQGRTGFAVDATKFLMGCQETASEIDELNASILTTRVPQGRLK